MKANPQGKLNKAKGFSRASYDNTKLLSQNSIIFFLGGIFLLTIILYYNSLRGSILNWDDNVYIASNSAIQKLDAEHFREIFSGFYASNYHPLTTLSWAIEFSIAGLKNIFLYHLDNLLLHLLNILLVFKLFRLVSKNDSVAMIIALFHAIHPMHVESVAWISERKDLLYTCFFLLSISMYCKYLVGQGLKMDSSEIAENSKNRKSTFCLSLSFIFFSLSLLSKSAAVILPPVLFLFDYLFKRKITAKLFLEKIPFFLMAILFGVLALKSQENVINDLPGYSSLEKILIINHSLLRYIFMAFIPIGLSAYHPWPALNDNSLSLIYYLSPLVTLIIVALIIYSMRKSRIIAFGFMFFVLNLILVIQIIPVGVAVIAERYSYLSYLGLFFIIATFLARKTGNENNREILKPASLIVIILATAGFSFATANRVRVWRNDKNLWDDMINNYPSTAYVAYYNRAKYFHENNNKEEAIKDLSKLIEWRKYYSEASTLRGSIYDEAGNLKDAISDYNNSIAFDSSYYLAYNNRGSARLKLNDLQGALNDFTMTIEKKGEYLQARYNRGAVKIAMKDFDGAIKDFEDCRQLNPSYCMSFYGMGNAFSGKGQFKEAVDNYSKSIECDPKFSDAFINRGNVKIQMNDLNGAISDFSKVIEIDPNYSYAWFNRGRIKAQLNDMAGAESDFNQTIQLNPRFGDSYIMLGNLKYNKGDKAGACAEWGRGAEAGNEICKNNLSSLCK